MRKFLPVVLSLLVLLLAGCGSSDSQPAEGGTSNKEESPADLPPAGLAAASSEEAGFPVQNLNDGKVETAWGSLSNADDVYAYVTFPKPLTRPKIKLQLFSPGARHHLNEIRIIARNGKNEPWTFIRSRISGSQAGPQEYSFKIGIPPADDASTVSIELDPADTDGKPFQTYGIACLRKSEGDVPNHLGKGGSGVYLRELTIEQ
jgi:hypothetical protein